MRRNSWNIRQRLKRVSPDLNGLLDTVIMRRSSDLAGSATPILHAGFQAREDIRHVEADWPIVLRRRSQAAQLCQKLTMSTNDLKERMPWQGEQKHLRLREGGTKVRQSYGNMGQA